MRKYFFTLLFCLTFLPCTQYARAADLEAPASVSPEIFQQIQTLLKRFIDPEKSPEEYAEFFADDAQYYKLGVVGKAKIAEDVARYSKRWPWRFYQLEKIESIALDPNADRVMVEYVIRFEVARPAKTISGKAYYMVRIADLNAIPKIERIEEVITRREPISTLED
ncbi:hypothetical protein BH11PSE11_BH11PSE11_04910 [soil metagenome]